MGGGASKAASPGATGQLHAGVENSDGLFEAYFPEDVFASTGLTREDVRSRLTGVAPLDASGTELKTSCSVAALSLAARARGGTGGLFVLCLPPERVCPRA